MINFPKGIAIFVPAQDLHNVNLWKHDLLINNYDNKFFTDRSFFKYNFLLINAYYQAKFNIENFRNIYKYPDDSILISDSGGFQMASFVTRQKSIDVNPLQILRWMENNRCDIAMNLDIPPWTNFNASLKQSVENFKLFEINRKNYDMRLYNVLHGRNFSEIKQWYDAIKDFSFDGWAYGVKPSNNVYLQTIAYLFLHEKGVINLNTSFHMFGVSSIQNMLALSMTAKHFDSSITFDSSTYATGTRFRDFYLPRDVRHAIRFGRKHTKQMNGIPCDCPVCRTIRIKDLYSQDDTTCSLLSLHNLYQFIEVNQMINSMVNDDDALHQYAISQSEGKTFDIINAMLLDYEKHDVSHVYNSFKHLMYINEENSLQRNLYSYKEI